MTSAAQVIGSLGVACAALSPISAAALDRTDCVFDTREGSVVVSSNFVNDVGQGFVVQTYQYSDRPNSSIDIIDHCPTGQRITADLANIGDYLVTAETPLPTPREVLEDAMAASQVYSFEDVRALIEASGTPATLATLAMESCGCAVFYPQARGNRTPWSRP